MTFALAAPRQQPQNLLFSKKDIIHLMIPLIIEQALTCFVGLADSIMVAQAG